MNCSGNSCGLVMLMEVREMEYVTKQMHTYRKGKTITDQFYIDDDYNVPDAKNDVKRVILGEGALFVEDMKVVENYIRVAGKLNFKVLYVTDEGEAHLSCLEGRIPFEEMVYLEEEPVGNLFIQSSSVDLTVTAIHSRKLNLKTLAELVICSEGKRETEITVDVDGDSPLYKRFENKELLKVFATKKDTYRIKEEVSVGGTKENIGTLLWTEVTSRKLDTRLEADELKLQGELLLFCFYESLDGKTDWIEQTIPYEGRIECYGAQDNMYHQIYPELADVNIDVKMDEDGEMRLIGVEATLEVRLIVYEEERLDVLADVYSLKQRCTPKFSEEMMERLLMQNHSKCKVTEQLSLPEIKDDILQICHNSARIQIEHTEVAEGGIQIEGVLHISFLYVKADDEIPFDTWQGMIPFSYLLESNETSEDMTYGLTHAVEQLSISLLGTDEIEIKAVLAFHSFLKKPVRLKNIREIDFQPIDMEEMEKRPGITGYIVRDGDILWDLAKRYNTTIDGIKEVNELETDEIKSGDRILIFKDNMSIL